MAEIQPIVSDLTIGNALVAIDCVNLKCIESVDIRIAMEGVPIICDWADGPATTLRGNPSASIDIMAMNMNSTILQYALDADVSVKAAAESVACEEHKITWVAEDVATPTYWTAVVFLNSPEVENVLAYTDSACAVAWEGEATPDNDLAITDSCTGELLLTTDDIDETDDTLYFAYDHNIETPIGATLIKPPMSTFADDHKLHILHRNATTGELELIKFWRAQIVPDFALRFDNTNRIVTVPIKLVAYADRANHPTAPIGQIVIISADDSEPADFSADFYKQVRSHV